MAESAAALLERLADPAKYRAEIEKYEALKAQAEKMAASAKADQIRANDDLATAKERHAILDRTETVLKARIAVAEQAQKELDANIAQFRIDEAGLKMRAENIAKAEARVEAALLEANTVRDQARSYEAQAYAKIEAIRKMLADISSF